MLVPPRLSFSACARRGVRVARGRLAPTRVLDVPIPGSRPRSTGSGSGISPTSTSALRYRAGTARRERAVALGRDASSRPRLHHGRPRLPSARRAAATRAPRAPRPSVRRPRQPRRRRHARSVLAGRGAPRSRRARLLRDEVGELCAAWRAVSRRRCRPGTYRAERRCRTSGDPIPVRARAFSSATSRGIVERLPARGLRPDPRRASPRRSDLRPAPGRRVTLAHPRADGSSRACTRRRQA